MPTNLPPEYFRAEENYRAAKDPSDKLLLLEEMIATIPKHKGTDKLRADLRRKLARLKESVQSHKKSGGHESLFHVEKEGAARAMLLGPPNTGKSALLAALTHAEPKIANSPYTTWSPIPGMMEYQHAQIQLIDTPPISREHIEPDLMGLIRTADLLILVVNLQRDPLQQVQETVAVLAEQGIYARCAESNPSGGPHAAVLPALVAVNKTDDSNLDEDFHIFCDLLPGEWPLVSLSAQTGRNLERFREMVWEQLELIRIYSRPPGKEPDYSAPFVLKKGSTVADFATSVHRDFEQNLKIARIWGRHVYDGQPVGKDHVLEDGDIVELHL